MKSKLPDVTLIGIDCIDIERLQAALDVSEKDLEFGEVKLLTSLPTSDERVVKIPHLGTIEDFSLFCIKDLCLYVDTEHVLMVQHDGFVLNPESWEDDFLNYDYIGAPWLVADWSVRNFSFPKESIGTRIVGNGGFSLRSKKFLEVSNHLFKRGKIPKFHPEDVAMCVWYRDLFEKEGIRFAPVEIAEKFSVEGEENIYKKQFGFHGFSWTNIDPWIDAHSECNIIVSAYKEARKHNKRDHKETEQGLSL